MKGYRLGTIKVENSEQRITFKGSISKETFLLVSKHTENIFEFKTQQELHTMFIINFLEFNDLFKLTIQNLLKNGKPLLDEDPNELKFISRNANRLFLNFLSSGRTFLDHSETYLKRKYGKKSSEFLKFKKETNNQYDSSFEYRFVYKLRNYAQHCGLPINNIIYSLDNEIQEKKYKRKINLSPIFDKEKLLKTYKDWGVKLKDDLKKKPSEIPVTSVLREYYKSMEVLNKTILKIEEESLQTSIEYLENFEKKYYEFELEENLQLCVFYNFKLSKPESYENSKFETYKLPKDVIIETKRKLQPTTAHRK